MFLSHNEFQDLKHFGKSIEISKEKHPKTKAVEKTKLRKKLKSIFEKHKIKNINFGMKKISKRTLILLIDISLAIKTTYGRLKETTYISFYLWNEKRKIKVAKISSKKEKIAYRLVETRKQRGNKTIIVRKRIPIRMNGNNFNLHKVTFDSTLDSVSGSEKDHVKTSSGGPRASIWDITIDLD